VGDSRGGSADSHIHNISHDARARFQAAQAARQRTKERDAVRLAYGARRDAPSHARTGQYRRCASCAWVFRAAEFRMDRRRLAADCALCRAERRAERQRRARAVAA
jgi:hypothetical protein